MKFEIVTKNTIDMLMDQMKVDFGNSYYGCQRAYIEWQYNKSLFHNSCFTENEYSMVIATENDRILAFDNFVPWQTYYKGKEITTFWDINWINSSRTRGLGREIMQEVRKRCEIYCGYSSNDMAIQAYKKAGCMVIDEIERKVAILNSRACIYAFKSDSEVANFLKKYETPYTRVDYKVIDDIEGISDKYWEDSLSRFEAISYRGKGYLNWRFVNHPYLNYSIISTDQKASKGIAVVRFEITRGNNYSIMRILDFLPTLGSENALTEAVLSYGRDKGAILADFLCASSSAADAICGKPLISLNVHSKFKIPYLFQPIETRKSNSFNMVFDRDDAYRDLNPAKLYATKADGELDIFSDQSGSA